MKRAARFASGSYAPCTRMLIWMLARHLDASSEARQEWVRFFKLKQDPRILAPALAVCYAAPAFR